MLAPRPAPGQAESTPLCLSLREGGIALGADVDLVLLVVPVRPQPGILFFFESGKHTDIDKDNNLTHHFHGSVSVPSQPFFGLRGSPGFLVFFKAHVPLPWALAASLSLSKASISLPPLLP